MTDVPVGAEQAATRQLLALSSDLLTVPLGGDGNTPGRRCMPPRPRSLESREVLQAHDGDAVQRKRLVLHEQRGQTAVTTELRSVGSMARPPWTGVNLIAWT